jgi:hypothetical protein
MTPIHTSIAFPSPRYLPPRPSKPSRLRTFLRHPVGRTIVIIVAWLVLLTGITLAAMFIGKAIGNARIESGPVQTVISTPVVTSTVVVTRSSAVVSTMDVFVTSSTEVAATSVRGSAVVTETASASALR